MCFLAEKVGPLIYKEEYPKLQALIRMVISRVKAVNEQRDESQKRIKDEFKYESYEEMIESLMNLAAPLSFVNSFITS